MWYYKLKQLFRAWILVVLACQAAGCYTQIKTAPVEYYPKQEPSGVSAEDLSVTTDYPWYDRSPSDRYVTIGAVFENDSRGRVFLSGCPYPPSYVIEKWEGGDWWDDVTYGVDCVAVHSTKTVEVRPGESLEFEADLRFPGWYRLRVLIGSDNKRPIAVVHSNQFLIR